MIRLLTSAQDVKVYVPNVNANKSQATLSAHLDWADLELQKLLDPALYAHLEQVMLTASAESQELPALESQIITFAKPVVAWHAYISILKNDGIQAGDAGLKETSPDQTAHVRQWVYNNALESAWEKADGYSENLLRFVELNAEKIPAYHQSPARKEAKSMFVQDIAQLQMWYDIENSLRLYQIVRRQFEAIELQYILPTLGFPLYQQLKKQLKDGAALSPSEQQVVNYCRAVITFYAINAALPSVNLNVRIGGLNIRRSDDGLVKKESPRNEDLTLLINHLTTRGAFWVQNLREFLLTSIQQLPAFRDSFQPANLPVNDRSKGVFYL